MTQRWPQVLQKFFVKGVVDEHELCKRFHEKFSKRDGSGYGKGMKKLLIEMGQMFQDEKVCEEEKKMKVM